MKQEKVLMAKVGPAIKTDTNIIPGSVSGNHCHLLYNSITKRLELITG
jgi:hypothetical protein